MCSAFAPTLANIIMTEFEQEIVKPLINSGLIRFYKRYVDDILILMRPSDVQLILIKFNSFHPNLQFTVDEFSDNDIHFLGIYIHPSGTSVYRKPTHTGQYSHISSFTPWSRKIAWIRALVNHVYKICSNATLLNNELKQIQNLMSWNGFPRKSTPKLINQFKPSPPVSNDNDNEATMTETNKILNIWLQLPYLGKFGERLTRSLIRKITPLLILKCRFIINWKSINSNVFVSCKDKTPKTYQSSVVYEFALDVIVGALAKLTAAYTPELRNIHITKNL